MFAQVDYLYIRLEATSAYVIVPVAKVPRTEYSSYQQWNRKEPPWNISRHGGEEFASNA